MIDRITSFIAQHQLIPAKSTIILGFSGGPDSVFLLHLLSNMHHQGAIARIIAAHLDHQWRPNSTEDVVFCRKQADLYNIEFVSTTLAKVGTFKGSREEVGRAARRTFLTTLAGQHNASLIALGHHYDDQQETFFIRLLRGASLTGLTGMRPQQGLYIRPLLETKKSDILIYLHEERISYLNDPTNKSAEFLRNRIRMYALPSLRACDQRFDTSFARILSHLQETEDFLAQLTQTTFENLKVSYETPYQLSVPSFLECHPALQRRLLVHWLCQERVQFPVTTQFFDEIMRFLYQPGNGKHQLHKEWSLIKRNARMQLFY
jgi:tRNA(Ile)-lysidine synthase